MTTTYLILTGLFISWIGWVLGRLRGDGENGAGQSLNISKGWDQFMIGSGLVVITFPIFGWPAFLLIPLQILVWSIKWGAYRDLGQQTSGAYDDESEPFIRKFLSLLGFPYQTEGVPYKTRFWKDYIGWSIRALMISSIGLFPIYAMTEKQFITMSIIFAVFMLFFGLFRLIDKDWMKWISIIPVGLLFAIPFVGGFHWLGLIGLLFPLVEKMFQNLEKKNIIEGAWGWAESAHGMILFLSVYIYIVLL